MPFKRVVRKTMPPKKEHGASSSRLEDPIPHTPPGLRQWLTPEQKEGLLQFWDPDIL